jgi:hypothetical protein
MQDTSIKLQIIRHIKKLNNHQQFEIFKLILKENNSQYTENCNGVFVDINLLSTATILAINNYITYCNNYDITINNNDKIKYNTNKTEAATYEFKQHKQNIVNMKKTNIKHIGLSGLKTHLTKFEKFIIGNLAQL